MSSIHQYLVWSHIVLGSVALILLWVPALARKGSRLHVVAGRWYVYSMYGVCVTALVTSLMVLADPLGVRQPGQTFTAERAAELASIYRMFSLFLLMLAVLVFVSIRHGLLALEARRRPDVLTAPLHRLSVYALAALAVPVGVLGLVDRQWLLVIFAGISLNVAFAMWRDLRIETPDARQLVGMHLGGLIGSGIGAYTAFFAFGGSTFFGEFLPGQWQVIAWVTPPIVGSILSARMHRKYGPRPAAAG